MKSPDVYTCDGCGKDLTTTSFSSQSRLVLTSQPMGHHPGPVFSMDVSPPIKQPHHFCNISCLETWLSPVGSAVQPNLANGEEKT